MVWYFIGVYITNRTLHGCLEIRNFSSRVENIFNECALQHSKRNFVSLRDHVIPSISYKGECQYTLCCYNGAVGECYQAYCWLRSLWASFPFRGKWRELHKNILTRVKPQGAEIRTQAWNALLSPPLPFPCSCLSSPVPLTHGFP